MMTKPVIPPHSALLEAAFVKAQPLVPDRTPVTTLYQEKEIDLDDKTEASLYEKKTDALCSALRQYCNTHQIPTPIIEVNEFVEPLDTITLFERRYAKKTFQKPAIYYETLLTHFEDITSAILRKNSDEYISIIKNLVAAMGACANGIHGHFDDAHKLIYSDLKIATLLSGLRDLSIHQIAQFYELYISQNIAGNNSIHLDNRLVRFAAERGFHVSEIHSSEIKDDNDHVLFDDEVEEYFTDHFFERYSPSTIVKCLEDTTLNVLNKIQTKLNLPLDEIIEIKQDSTLYPDLATELKVIPFFGSLWGDSAISKLFVYDVDKNQLSRLPREKIRFAIIHACLGQLFRSITFNLDQTQILHVIPGCAEISYIEEKQNGVSEFHDFVSRFEQTQLWHNPEIHPDFFRQSSLKFPLSTVAFLNYYRMGNTDFSHCDLSRVKSRVLANPLAFLYMFSQYQNEIFSLKSSPTAGEFFVNLPTSTYSLFSRDLAELAYDHFVSGHPDFPDSSLARSMKDKSLNYTNALLPSHYIELCFYYRDFEGFENLSITQISNILSFTTQNALILRVLDKIGDVIIQKILTAPTYLHALERLLDSLPERLHFPFLMRFNADDLTSYFVKNRITMLTLAHILFGKDKVIAPEFYPFIKFLGHANLSKLLLTHADISATVSSVRRSELSEIFQLIGYELLHKIKINKNYFFSSSFISITSIEDILYSYQLIEMAKLMDNMTQTNLAGFKFILAKCNRNQSLYVLSLMSSFTFHASFPAFPELYQVLTIAPHAYDVIEAYGEEAFSEIVLTVNDIFQTLELLDENDGMKFIKLLGLLKLNDLISDKDSFCKLLRRFTGGYQLCVLALLTPNYKLTHIQNDDDFFAVMLSLDTCNHSLFLSQAAQHGWLSKVSEQGLARIKAVFAREEKSDVPTSYLSTQRLRWFRPDSVRIGMDEMQLICQRGSSVKPES